MDFASKDQTDTTISDYPIDVTDPSSLVAWSGDSYKKDHGVYVMDLASKTEHSYIPEKYFIPSRGGHWFGGGVLQSIPETKNLINVKFDNNDYARLCYFDVGKKDLPRQLSVFELDLADPCPDIAYNTRRQYLIGLPVEDEISYHIFKVTGSSCKLVRTSGWYRSLKNASFVSYDINPDGNIALMGTTSGGYVLNYIETGEFIGKSKIKTAEDIVLKKTSFAIEQCRWSKLPEDGTFFALHHKNYLSSVNVSKGLAKTTAISVPEEKQTNQLSMDVQPNSGNIVALCGEDRSAHIFDKRNSQFISLLPPQSGSEDNQCIRWNGTGTALAIASDNGTVRLVDMATRKVTATLTANYPHEVPSNTVCFI